MNIAILAAGAGGMYCGSCLRDNALARGLHSIGQQPVLVPLYTPLRLDSTSCSIPEVFFGGVNVWLQCASGLFRHTPRMIDWLFDRPWLLNLAGKYGAQTSPAKLGPFVLSVLRGDEGPAAKELDRLIRFLRDLKPDIVTLPNLMFIGMARALRDELGAKVICELTGEDVFLDVMVEPYRAEAQAIIRQRVGHAAGLVATSHYYAAKMADYLGVDASRIDTVYPSVSAEMLLADGTVISRQSTVNSGKPTVGTIAFLARICPEKGFDRLIDALAILRQRPAGRSVRLRYGGWMGQAQRQWLVQQQDRISQLGLADAVEYLGELEMPAKLALIDSADVLCVPTRFPEPKGIYVLEALARGVPVVMPAHGAFPELIAKTGGGLLATPDDAEALADKLAELLAEPHRGHAMGQAGHRAVREGFLDHHMARGMLAVYERILRS